MRIHLNKIIIFSLIIGFISCVGYFSLAINENMPEQKTQKQEDYRYLIEVNGKYGYINKFGKVIINPQFDDAFDFSEDLAAVRLGDKYGFINKSGKVIIVPKYDDVKAFSESLAAVWLGDKWGFIDKTGKIVIKPGFDNVFSFSEGMAEVQVQNKWGFVNKNGDLIINPTFERVSSFSKGMAGVESQGKWGFIDKTGKFIIKPRFNAVQPFSEGLAYVEINYPNSGVPQKFAYINKSGQFVKIKTENMLQYGSFNNVLSCKYIDEKTGKELDPENLGYTPVRGIERECPRFSEDLLMVYYNKSNNIGFIDKKGILKVKTNLKWTEGDMPPILDFANGLAAFSVNDKWGFIDKTGKTAIKNKFTTNVCNNFCTLDGLSFDNNDLAIACIQYNNFVKYGYIDKSGKFIWSYTSANNNIAKTNNKITNTVKNEDFIDSKTSEDKYNKYRKILSNLPNNKLESIKIAQNTYFKYFSLQDKQIYRDNAFKVFKDFIEKVCSNLRIEDSYQEIEKKKDYYANFDLTILFGEGEPFAVINFKYLDKQFSKYLSNSWKDYLKLNANEDKNRFEEDYQILIPWDDIRIRIINRENFINKYPDFSENIEIKKYLEGYLKSYIEGLDNSKVTNYPKNNKLRIEIKKSYEKFIRYNRNSQYYKLIADYYELLKKHNFIIGEYVNKFLEEKGLGYEN